MFSASDLKNLDKNQLLNLIGLETRRESTEWVVPTLGAFTAGLLLGAGVALLLAPKTGTELREDLAGRFQAGATDLQSRTASAASALRSDTNPRST